MQNAYTEKGPGTAGFEPTTSLTKGHHANLYATGLGLYGRRCQILKIRWQRLNESIIGKP